MFLLNGLFYLLRRINYLTDANFLRSLPPPSSALSNEGVRRYSLLVVCCNIVKSTLPQIRLP